MKYYDKHNQVGFLKKPEESTGFAELVLVKELILVSQMLILLSKKLILSKKTKKHIREEQASLAEIVRLQAQEEVEYARKAELERQDALIAKRVQDELELVPFLEAEIHLRKMWSKYGLGRMFVNANSVYFFKFRQEEGVKFVMGNGPWMVNNKPLYVQKWRIDLNLHKSEPKSLPVWVKLINVPMEAWSTKGISAIASCLGKPMIMDDMTTRML
ncbi:zinc knuckle CX2CX4HX4C containing protein [Tanacetum coccineum]